MEREREKRKEKNNSNKSKIEKYWIWSRYWNDLHMSFVY